MSTSEGRYFELEVTCLKDRTVEPEQQFSKHVAMAKDTYTTEELLFVGGERILSEALQYESTKTAAGTFIRL